MDLLSNLARHRTYHPDRTAVIGSSDEMTYRELADYADKLAAQLSSTGFRAGDRFALLLENDLGFIAAYAGIRAAGGVVVPINFRLSAAEVSHQLRDSDARGLLTQTTWPSLAELRADCPVPLLAITPGQRLETDRLNGLELGSSDIPCPAHVERLMYTSGTTSRPKGVMITTEQSYIGATARCVDFGLTNESVTLTVAPLYHVGGLDSFTLPVLMAGGTVVLCTRFDPPAVLDAIERHRVSSAWLPPTMLRQLFAKIDRGATADVSSLRVVLGGGEKAPRPVLERLAIQWPHAGYYDAYGLTECQGMASYLPASHSHSHMGSVGLAAFTRRVRIVDDTGAEVPAGELGEIVISGPVVSPGYWQNPQATAEAFRDGWLHTGDIGYLDADGFLYIADRLKDMIRSGLENVASTEIERVLYEHPAVDQAAVIGRDHPKWGEVPIAFIVAKAELSAEELQQHCRAQLAKFKVPADVYFVDDLPRTPSGKIQKHHLRTRA